MCVYMLKWKWIYVKCSGCGGPDDSGDTQQQLLCNCGGISVNVNVTTHPCFGSQSGG